MGESTRLAPAQLLTIQETGIGTQLWKKIMDGQWTVAFIHIQRVYRMLDNQYVSRQ